MKTEFQNSNPLFEEIPYIIEPSINMESPNTPFLIFKGSYTLQVDSKSFLVEGEITFNWVTDMSVKFSGIIILNGYNEDSLISKVLKIYIENEYFGDGFITNISTKTANSPSKSIYICGTMTKDAIIGQKSLNIDKVRFSIPNLREIYGKPVKTNSKEITSNRLTLNYNNTPIFIDKCSNYTKKKELLSEYGGYIILYGGELVCTNGTISIKEVNDIFCCLDTFLTFINGQKTATQFLQGMLQETTIWNDYTPKQNNPYQSGISSWIPQALFANIEPIWCNYRNLWEQPDDTKNVLKMAIHWYSEANCNKGGLEGSIILAQTALELLYNWRILEKLQCPNDRKSQEKISADSKIKELVKLLKLTNEIPSTLHNLHSYANSNLNQNDGPKTITEIRNTIVHSNQKKRNKLYSLSTLVKYEGLQLSLWYIELTLLHILGYNYKYSNRCSDKVYTFEVEEFVPWQSN